MIFFSRRPIKPFAATLFVIMTFCVCMILGNVLSLLFFPSGGAIDYWPTCAVLAVNSLVVFALPGVLCRRAVAGKIADRSRPFLWSSVAFSVIILVLVSQPFIAWASVFNEQVVAWLGFGGGSEDDSESAAFLGRVLDEQSFWGVAMSVVLVALLPAVSEELFFRGTLMPLVKRCTGSWHVAIVGSAAIFSLMHLDAEGFLPRFIMGGILGVLLYMTKKLWVPMLFHFTNNLFVVINVIWSDESTVELLNAETEDPGVWLSIISVIFTLGEIHFIGIATGFHRLPFLSFPDDEQDSK